MQITVTGRHMDITDSLRGYAEEKVGRASKIIDQDTMTAEVVLQHERNPRRDRPNVAEVTVYMKGRVVRAEESADDMYAAVDLAADKVERQLRKYKSRLLEKRDNGVVRVKTAPGDEQLAAAQAAAAMPEEPEEARGEPQVVRSKMLDMKPMTEEEAILQLELVAHDFFVFLNAETDSISVLYKRADGDYGVIRTRA